jgi:hypothetical protein
MMPLNAHLFGSDDPLTSAAETNWLVLVASTPE